MGNSYGASIAKEGLVLYLDAANIKSYPGSGSDFFDISGMGNHHSITGSAPYSDGRFTLNGSTQGFSRLSSMSGVTTTCTVVIFYATTDTAELWVQGNQNNSWFLSASNYNNYYHQNVGSPTNHVDLSTIVRPDSPINYRNGAFHMWEAKNVNFSTWTAYEWFLYPSPWQMAGSVSAIMVYDKVLSPEESQKNFNAFRGRYDI